MEVDWLRALPEDALFPFTGGMDVEEQEQEEEDDAVRSGASRLYNGAKCGVGASLEELTSVLEDCVVPQRLERAVDILGSQSHLTSSILFCLLALLFSLSLSLVLSFLPLFM